MAESRAESLVQQLNELRRESWALDGWKRDGRLGRKPGAIRRIGWLPGGFADGWFGSNKFEPMPRYIYGLFFETLTNRQREVGDQINRITAELKNLGADHA